MRKVFAGIVIAVTILIGIFYGFAFISRKPVLFQVLADSNCACGDYHQDVTGLIALNPFRDRSPENAAGTFLENLRNGRCTADTSICRYALDNHRVSAWRLANVRNVGNRTLLYYKLTKFGSDEAKYRLQGEGLIEVIHAQDGWTVANYSSYF
jgi:hypothetical protein